MLTRLSVDEELCIGCGLCHERAPHNVDVPSGAQVAKITKQPTSDAEEAACLEAAEYCPTGGLLVRGRRGER